MIIWSASIEVKTLLFCSSQGVSMLAQIPVSLQLLIVAVRPLANRSLVSINVHFSLLLLNTTERL